MGLLYEEEVSLCGGSVFFAVCFMMRFLTLLQPFIFIHAQGVDAVSFENEWLW